MRKRNSVVKPDIDIDQLEALVLGVDSEPNFVMNKQVRVNVQKELKLTPVVVEEEEKYHVLSNILNLRGKYDQIVEIPESLVRVEDKMDFEMYPEDKNVPILSSLASVGIVSDVYAVSPKFFPHGREFYLLPSLGEFSYKGETVEDFFFPTLGAEKFGRGTFQSIGIASRDGVYAHGVYSDIIDAAREKLDGVEIIVYTIKTKNYRESFKWSQREHVRLVQPVDPGHFEEVDGVVFFLSGYNSLGGKRHEWEYLTDGLVEKVKESEGLIVRMSGKEYRLPWKHSATLSVVNRKACDHSGSLSVDCEVSDGLYDFIYDESKHSWSVGKKRIDKNRPDHITGINDMIMRTSTLKEFLENVAVGRNRAAIPKQLIVVPLSQVLRDKVAQSKNPHLLKVRVSGNYKQPDSYRRILIEDLTAVGKVDNMSIVPTRPNIIVSSGRVMMLKRHSQKLAFKIGKKIYVSDVAYGKGVVKYIHLSCAMPFSLSLVGPVLRVYEYDDGTEGDVVELSLERQNLSGKKSGQGCVDSRGRERVKN